MCFVRKFLEWVFSRHELKWLDDIMPEAHKREKEKKKQALEQQEQEKVVVIGASTPPTSGPGAVNIYPTNPASANVSMLQLVSSRVTPASWPG